MSYMADVHEVTETTAEQSKNIESIGYLSMVKSTMSQMETKRKV